MNFGPVLDACSHPVGTTGDDIRRHMPKPWAKRAFPGPERYSYASAKGEYLTNAAPENGLAGSDPALLFDMLDREGTDRVVLVPLTRGLLANTDLATAVCRGTNDWLAKEWLARPEWMQRTSGTFRINPSDPREAVREIERLASDGRFVQAAIPMQSHHPYGQRMYWPIWQAAAEAGLPVLLHGDGGSSIDFPPSAAGYLRYAAEYSALYPINVAYHLASFVAEGVFERLPELRIVCGEGALSAFVPVLWRLDKDWRSTREEVPWVKQLPSEYVRRNVRFLMHRLDIPYGIEAAEIHEWWRICHASELLIYAGNYPQRDYLSPAEAIGVLDGSSARAVLWDNGAALYGLDPDRTLADPVEVRGS